MNIFDAIRKFDKQLVEKDYVKTLIAQIYISLKSKSPVVTGRYRASINFSEFGDFKVPPEGNYDEGNLDINYIKSRLPNDFEVMYIGTSIDYADDVEIKYGHQVFKLTLAEFT